MAGMIEAVLLMECPECGFEATTPADNSLVNTGGFTCPEDNKQMEIKARYEKVEED